MSFTFEGLCKATETYDPGIGMPFYHYAMQTTRGLLQNWYNYNNDLIHVPVMKKKDVHAQSISLKNINFRAGKQFKKEVGQQMRPERGASFTRPHGKGRSEEECLKLINEHLQRFPCLTRADYCRMTGHDKQRAINELNIFIERGLLIRYGAGKLVVYAKKTEE
jgi:hypothetical protein